MFKYSFRGRRCANESTVSGTGKKLSASDSMVFPIIKLLSQGSDEVVGVKVKDDCASSDVAQLKRVVKFEKGPGQRFGASLCGRGKSVYVTWVVEGSPAFRAGLRPGDRIECVNGFMVEEGACPARSKTVLEMLTNSDKLKIKVCDGPLTSSHTVTLQKGATMPTLPITNGLLQLTEPGTAGQMWAGAGVRHGTVVVAINGKEVVGVQDKEVAKKIARKLSRDKTVELTCVPGWLGVELITEWKRRWSA